MKGNTYSICLPETGLICLLRLALIDPLSFTHFNAASLQLPKDYCKPGVAEQAFNPSSWEPKAVYMFEASLFQDSLGDRERPDEKTNQQIQKSTFFSTPLVGHLAWFHDLAIGNCAAKNAHCFVVGVVFLLCLKLGLPLSSPD